MNRKLQRYVGQTLMEMIEEDDKEKEEVMQRVKEQLCRIRKEIEEDVNMVHTSLIRIYSMQPTDKEWRTMWLSLHYCKEAGVEIPDKVVEYFENNRSANDWDKCMDVTQIRVHESGADYYHPGDEYGISHDVNGKYYLVDIQKMVDNGVAFLRVCTEKVEK